MNGDPCFLGWAGEAERTDAEVGLRESLFMEAWLVVSLWVASGSVACSPPHGGPGHDRGHWLVSHSDLV